MTLPKNFSRARGVLPGNPLTGFAVLRDSQDDGAGKKKIDSPATRFILIDITTPSPPAQEGI
jgi:hypothetical protein